MFWYSAQVYGKVTAEVLDRITNVLATLVRFEFEGCRQLATRCLATHSVWTRLRNMVNTGNDSCRHDPPSVGSTSGNYTLMLAGACARMLTLPG